MDFKNWLEQEEAPQPVLMSGQAMLVGVQHAYPIILPKPQDQILAHLRGLAPRGVWFEGDDKAEDPVQEFCLKELGVSAKNMKTWEVTPETMYKKAHFKSFYTLFAQSPEIILRQYQNDPSWPQYSQMNIFDAIVAGAHVWQGWQNGHPITAPELEKLLLMAMTDPDTGKIAPKAKYLMLMAKNNKMTPSNLKHFIQIGYSAMWPDNWQQGPTAFSRMANDANRIRDNDLAEKMMTTGGVFFAGQDHIQLVDLILKRKGVQTTRWT